NEVTLEFTCSELLQQNDNASLIPADKKIAAVVLYAFNIQSSNGNTCNKSEIFVDRDLVLTDTLFHSYSTKTIRNANQQIQGEASSLNPQQNQGEASSSDPQGERKKKKTKLFGVIIG
uniref:Uncharacterized protein n=1 Tax=Meloidogyne javanica TaxID=6303 RepID=A0A915LYG7_MELJA